MNHRSDDDFPPMHGIVDDILAMGQQSHPRIPWANGAQVRSVGQKGNLGTECRGKSSRREGLVASDVVDDAKKIVLGCICPS